MDNIANTSIGISMYRIEESTRNDAKLLTFYGQAELQEDLFGVELKHSDRKQMRISDNVPIVKEGDIIFSLISGTATIVTKEHDGYIWNQNYAKIELKKDINKEFFVYLLNEHKYIKKQFHVSLQGSQVLRYSVKQLKELVLPKLPNKNIQKLVGKIYFKQVHLKALKERLANNEAIKTLELLKGVV